MTIHQLPEPCWVIDPNPWGDDEAGIVHYSNEAGALEGLNDLRAARKDAPGALAGLKGAAVRQEAAPCWVADCDGVCGERFHDEEAGGSHFGEPDDFASYLQWDGWATSVPDGAICSGCTPESAEPVPPPSPAELEAAGQMRLPGVT